MDKWYSHGGKRQGSGRKKRPKPKIINLRVTPALKEAIEKEADQQGMSINQYLVFAIENQIEQKKHLSNS